MTPIDRRSEILEQIRQCVCRDRCATHGDAEDNFKDIAMLWSWWISKRYGIKVTLDELDSAEMMNLMKSTRKAKTPFHLDHWVDGGGYNVCGAGIVKKALDEQALKKELDGLAPAVDHGEEELKKQVGQPVGKQEPATRKTLDDKAAVLEGIYPPDPERCRTLDCLGHRCGLPIGHVEPHYFNYVISPIQECS